MARGGMANLIERVRVAIGDTAGANQVFSDDEIQNALDVHKWDVRYLELTAVETIAAGGEISYLDFYAPFGDWEETVSLVDGGYNALTPATSDTLAGHFTLSTEPTLPVRIVGSHFDLFGAQADLLEAWAAKLAREFDFGVAGQSFHRSQQAKELREQARLCRLKQQVRTIETHV